MVAPVGIAHFEEAPQRGAHTLHALEDLDVLAFGPRLPDESPRFPRLGFSLVGPFRQAWIPQDTPE